MTGGGRPRSSSPASPPENDDLLSNILLGLPPTPSSLPRASLVCKRWRRLVSDPGFLRRFRARHRRSAPLLGFFTEGSSSATFTPTLEPPDRLPHGRFSMKLDNSCQIVSCRHGLVLILKETRSQALVWDPVTGDLSHVPFPSGFGDGGSAVVTHGAVLRAGSDVHGGEDHSIPFLVALVGKDEAATRALACVYSSVTGVWSNLISTACPSMGPSMFPMYFPSTLVGGSLYWFLDYPSTSILEFDLDRQSLAAIDVPPGTFKYFFSRPRLIPAVDGGLGFLCLSDYNAQLWTRKTDCDGVARWVRGRTIELDKLLSLNSEEGFLPVIVGFAEEDNMSFVATNVGIFMVQLESMQFKKHFKMLRFAACHPFSSVYTAGLGIDGEQDGADLLQNT